MTAAALFPCLYRRLALSQAAGCPAKELVLLHWQGRKLTATTPELTSLLDQIRTATNGTLSEVLLSVIGSYCNALEGCILTLELNPRQLGPDLKVTIVTAMASGRSTFSESGFELLLQALAQTAKDTKSEEFMGHLTDQIIPAVNTGRLSKEFLVKHQKLIATAFKTHAKIDHQNSMSTAVQLQTLMSVFESVSNLI